MKLLTDGQVTDILGQLNEIEKNLAIVDEFRTGDRTSSSKPKRSIFKSQKKGNRDD